MQIKIVQKLSIVLFNCLLYFTSYSHLNIQELLYRILYRQAQARLQLSRLQFKFISYVLLVQSVKIVQNLEQAYVKLAGSK